MEAAGPQGQFLDRAGGRRYSFRSFFEGLAVRRTPEHAPAEHRRLGGLMIFLLALSCAEAARASDVVIVKSKDLAAYEKAISGFREKFKGSVVTLTMQGRLADPANLATAVREAEPRAVLAVGLKAAKALRAEISDIPVVFCLATTTSQNKLRAANVAGVDVEPPMREQFRAIQEVAPKIRKLGLIVDPKHSAALLADARRAAGELGLELVVREVKERREVGEALRQILQQIDGLWLLRDATVITREFLDQALILQAEKKIPVLAYSDQFVRRGAVAAFAASYQSQGRKAAQVVSAILEGAKAGEMPLQTPEGALIINRGAAERAGLSVPEAVLGRPGVQVVGQ